MSVLALHKRLMTLAVAIAAFVTVAAPIAGAVPFTVMTYNVHGLPPQIVVGGQVFEGNLDSPTTIPQIAAKLTANIGDWDVVGIQEAFVPAYYDAISAASPNTPAIDPAVAPSLVGSGLTRLSQNTFADHARVTWDDVQPLTADSLADKGFSMARHTLEGETVDIYNMHAQAGQSAGAVAVRNAQLVQFAAFINSNSAGNAVIVLGDTNSLHSRVADTLGSFLTATNLTDSWVELMNGGVIPGTQIAGCASEPETDAVECERVDKVLYRSSSTLALSGVDYTLRTALFQDIGLNELSDHRAVQVAFDAQAVPEPGTATLLMVGLLSLAAGRKQRA